MLKVSKNQLEQLRAIYGELQTKATKHGIYIEASEDALESYQRFLTTKISKKQKNALHWLYKRRRKQETPTD